MLDKMIKHYEGEYGKGRHVWPANTHELEDLEKILNIIRREWFCCTPGLKYEMVFKDITLNITIEPKYHHYEIENKLLLEDQLCKLGRSISSDFIKIKEVLNG